MTEETVPLASYRGELETLDRIAELALSGDPGMRQAFAIFIGDMPLLDSQPPRETYPNLYRLLDEMTDAGRAK